MPLPKGPLPTSSDLPLPWLRRTSGSLPSCGSRRSAWAPISARPTPRLMLSMPQRSGARWSVAVTGWIPQLTTATSAAIGGLVRSRLPWTRQEFSRRVEEAFAVLEPKVAAGKIRRYGTATWNGYRQPHTAQDYLSLAELVASAEQVGGPEHHFKVVQLPYNLAMPEAL